MNLNHHLNHHFLSFPPFPFSHHLLPAISFQSPFLSSKSHLNLNLNLNLNLILKLELPQLRLDLAELLAAPPETLLHHSDLLLLGREHLRLAHVHHLHVAERLLQRVHALLGLHHARARPANLLLEILHLLQRHLVQLAQPKLRALLCQGKEERRENEVRIENHIQQRLPLCHKLKLRYKLTSVTIVIGK